MKEKSPPIGNFPREIRTVTLTMVFVTTKSSSPDAIVSERGFLASFWRRIFKEAKERQASDIHLESLQSGLQVRLRRKGILIEPFDRILNHNDGVQIVDKLKEIAQLDLTNKSVLQDTSFSLSLTNSRYRLSLSPGFQHGECAVLRIINNDDRMSLDRLNLEKDVTKDIVWALNEKQGLFLVTGPTGSGKSSTLQAAIAEIDHKERKIISIENPPERILPGVVHEEVTNQYGWSESIKGALRQDPDVILIGEIRDKESAKLAVEAAQTGHLVFSTLHTNDVPGTISRLLTLGVERHLIADALLFVSAQRLLKKLCQCKTPYNQFFKRSQNGCERCDGTGYSGRFAILEYCLKPNPDLIYRYNPKEFANILKRNLLEETIKCVHKGIVDYRLAGTVLGKDYE